MTWDMESPGVIELPSGRRVRGRRMGASADPEPDFGLYLVWRRPMTPWPHRWVKWPDFGLPVDGADARDALADAWARADNERVEIACGGGRGRTGTALAGLAMMDGLEHEAAIAWVREQYDPRAVETPWQRRWLGR